MLQNKLDKMQKLSIGNIRKWMSVATPNVRIPTCIGFVCNYCKSPVEAATKDVKYDSPRHTISCTCVCTACGRDAHFWLLNVTAGATSVNRLELYMQGAGPEYLKIADHRNRIPADIYSGYMSAIKADQAGNPLATAVLCEHTRRMIIRDLFPHKKKRKAVRKILGRAGKTGQRTSPLHSIFNFSNNDRKRLAYVSARPDTAAASVSLELLGEWINGLYISADRIAALESYLLHAGRKKKKKGKS